MKVVAMVDCNNFYASCERLFSPQNSNRPVIVLSNNDGCVVSRSQEAKDLGVKMAAPYFMIADLVKQHNIAVFSSNYTLYADMSARVMNNLTRFTPDVEVYSIDECFLQFEFHESVSLEELAIKIRTQVSTNTGIPVSVGIAPSKTLAKIANQIAKKDPLGVMVLDSNDKITDKLATFPVKDVWGIGRASNEKYLLNGIKFASEIRNQPLEWIQKTFTIHGARMWHELYGKSVIPFGHFPERKKGICSSRSFGKLTDDIAQLKQAAVSHTTRVAEKLRQDRSCCSVLSIRLITNKFRNDLKQYYPSVSIPLAQPVNNTLDLVKVAVKAIEALYQPGYMFMKVEVVATGLIPQSEVQLNLFNNWCSKNKDKLSNVVDILNSHYGKGTIRVAGESYTQKWKMRQEHLSPNYTTNWNDIVKI